MDIHDIELAQDIIDIITQEGWEEVFSDRDNITFKVLGADPYSNHVIKIEEDGDAILVREIEDGEIFAQVIAETYAWDESLDEVRTLVENASGGIY